ncbi:MAG TPA: glycosyltransferase family 39 protein [Patescibacteria group bacterium]
MFALGIIIGFYAYIIFTLGMLHLLYTPVLAVITIAFFGAVLTSFASNILKLRFSLPKTRLNVLLIALISIQALINYVGVLGPELGFDALWYHLTIPKLFLQNHSIYHIGGILYYSDMPKLVEMLYIPALAFGNEILAKNIHFFFGILCVIAIYLLGKRVVGEKAAILASVIFYANLVVGFESISAYIDLGRTFFEILAFWSFYLWSQNKKYKWFVFSCIFVGLAITTKLIALGSVLIFLTLIIWILKGQRKSISKIIKQLVIFTAIALLIPLPWFIFSFMQTHNIIYPLFTNTYPIHFQFSMLNPLTFVANVLNVFLHADDPLNPIYVIILPIMLFCIKKLYTKQPLLLIYSFLATIIWYITPQTGGGRFILAYLPIISLLTSFTIMEIENTTKRDILVGTVIFLSIVSIAYRGFANAKFIPVILSKETKAQFLAKNLNFYFGDFYDIDGYFAKTIKPTDHVLLLGFHNLYYVDFPFTDSSWAKKDTKYNYIAMQREILLSNCGCWKEVYKNSTTNVIVYKYKK